jgi:tetratricopeptide (TPR) repeat protein
MMDSVRTAVIVLTGASGAGKTTLVLALDEQRRAGVACVNCDRTGQTLAQWIQRMLDDRRIEVAVLDTQVRPSDARRELARAAVAVSRVVLVDCEPARRNERLRESRGQADLATPGMDCWAAYLRGQADALQLPIIDTTSAAVGESLATLGDIAAEVLREVRGAAHPAGTLIEAAERALGDHRLADAHRDFSAAVALARQHGGRELVRALRGLAQIERAVPLHEEAVALCRREGDPLLLAHTIRDLGELHQEAGRLAEAEPCYREALALYRGHHETPPLHLANALRPLALLEERLGRREAARTLWQEARDLYASVQVREGMDEAEAHLGAP